MPSFTLATRGSALALAQAKLILAQCRAAFPESHFALTIVKTTGDKLQTAALAQEGRDLPKGLFTKELEVALLEHQADLAVHSLKDLPTTLPAGLTLGAVSRREDVRDVLLYREAARRPAAGPPPVETAGRGFPAGLGIAELPPGAVVATSSTRRKALLLALNPGLRTPEIRGNVATRLQKLAQRAELDATILALAGLTRLEFKLSAEGRLDGQGVPAGLLGTVLDTEVMLPCVGQGAIGIEVRADDEHAAALCQRLNHPETLQAVTAERAFLAAMGGGCQSPVAAYAQVRGSRLTLRAASFAAGPIRRAQADGPIQDPAGLGERLAARLKG